ncbi:MAG: hypothetical protein ABSB74_04525 [Tepidisphaeraceae bacterium]
MRVQRRKRTARPAGARASNKKARIEVVDHSHARWPAVLKLIGRLGDRNTLLLDEDGWLSARQSVLAAFVGDKPAGYLIFHIHPLGDGRVEARLDAAGFSSAEVNRLLSTALSHTATQHARKLKCVRFKGLKIKTDGRR